ncbi:hypothetical protein [Anaeromassilibacillus sp. SJQ-1]|uniref:hypothetical protein n=1 Tax=Anaeromassilibacillus sp. SJQ-1 TaxID=3375419 RepID=UPI003988D1F1
MQALPGGEGLVGGGKLIQIVRVRLILDLHQKLPALQRQVPGLLEVAVDLGECLRQLLQFLFGERHPAGKLCVGVGKGLHGDGLLPVLLCQDIRQVRLPLGFLVCLPPGSGVAFNQFGVLRASH